MVHDWGGVLGLPWAAQNRDLIARLVVLDTGLYLYRAGTRMSEAWWAFRNHVEGSRGHRGDQDPIIPPKVAEAMARRIPGTHRVETVRAGHFLREDAGPEIGRLIAAFVDETS